jgi:hypothetical protein
LAIFGYVPFCPNLLKTNCIGGGIVDLKKCWSKSACNLGSYWWDNQLEILVYGLI